MTLAERIERREDNLRAIDRNLSAAINAGKAERIADLKRQYESIKEELTTLYLQWEKERTQEVDKLDYAFL